MTGTNTYSDKLSINYKTKLEIHSKEVHLHDIVALIVWLHVTLHAWTIQHIIIEITLRFTP